MVNYDKFFDEKIKEIAKEKIIIDIGGATPYQKELMKYKGYFKECDYKSLDCDPNTCPDIVGDAHNLPLEDESIDAVICKSVLEHLHSPEQAVNEMHRVLKKDGKCLVYLPFLHAYHGNERYPDYYRYTYDGVRYLFRNFRTIEMCPTRGHLETIINLLPYQNKFPINIFIALSRWCDKLFSRYQSKRQVSGFNLFLIK